MKAIRLGSIVLLTMLSLSIYTSCYHKIPEVTRSDELEKTKISSMQFVSGTANGGWAQIAAAIADKTNRHFKGYPITATTGGAISNPVKVSKGDAQIGLSQGIFLSKALLGEEPYDVPIDNIRGIASLESTALYFITDKDIGADSLGEIINKHIKVQLGTLPKSAASNMAMQYVFHEYGLDGIDDIQEPGTSIYLAEGSALYSAYNDGYFNLMITNEAVPDAATRELLSTRESKILSLDSEIIKALVEKYDWSLMTIPAGTYPGQMKDVQTVGIKSVLIVHQDVPEELAYYLAKTVYENKAYLETVQASYKAINADDMPKYLTVPIHPGAEKYYKELDLIK